MTRTYEEQFSHKGCAGRWEHLQQRSPHATLLNLDRTPRPSQRRHLGISLPQTLRVKQAPKGLTPIHLSPGLPAQHPAGADPPHAASGPAGFWLIKIVLHVPLPLHIPIILAIPIQRKGAQPQVLLSLIPLLFSSYFSV